MRTLMNMFETVVKETWNPDWEIMFSQEWIIGQTWLRYQRCGVDGLNLESGAWKETCTRLGIKPKRKEVERFVRDHA